MRTTAQAIGDALISPNEIDRNLEPANVVDGLFAIARALDRNGQAIDNVAKALQDVAGGLKYSPAKGRSIAEALEVAAAVLAGKRDSDC